MSNIHYTEAQQAEVQRAVREAYAKGAREHRGGAVMSRPKQNPLPTPLPAPLPPLQLEPSADERFMAWVRSWGPDQAKTACLFATALGLLCAAVWSQIVG